jgi:hypothetical protein
MKLFVEQDMQDLLGLHTPQERRKKWRRNASSPQDDHNAMREREKKKETAQENHGYNERLEKGIIYTEEETASKIDAWEVCRRFKEEGASSPTSQRIKKKKTKQRTERERARQRDRNRKRHCSHSRASQKPTPKLPSSSSFICPSPTGSSASPTASPSKRTSAPQPATLRTVGPRKAASSS